MPKKTLRDSDLWPITVVLGLMTLGCLMALAASLLRDESQEAFRSGFLAVLFGGMAAACAFVDRGPAMRTWAPTGQDDLDAP